MNSPKIQQNIELLQGFYRFLYLGKFLEKFIKDKDISSYATDFPIHTGEKKNFVLKGAIVKKMLSDIHAHPDQKNIFGYMVEINSFKGMFSVMREMIETQENFQLFLAQKLQDKYFAFEHIIRFLRNVLNHIETADIKIKITDFIKQKDYLSKEKQISKISFDMKYADYFVEWKGGKDYGLNIVIDFYDLKEGQKIFDIIPLHQVYLLAEFCFNLSEIYRNMLLRTKKVNTHRIQRKK
ncbi:MAG TPA: hypothetical protein PKC87_00385 [Candidatus Absconditabacterales bacterium]|nr:hypothetical protein [Candidatus Absconditabacterales bacterium]